MMSMIETTIPDADPPPVIDDLPRFDEEALTAARDVLGRLVGNPPPCSVVLDITPALAAALLERNTDNRPFSWPTLRKCQERMRRGWHLTGETIIVSKSGRLLDGQHRCKAGLSTGITFPAHVVFGIDDDVFPFIDVGKTRNAADVFAINGVRNASITAAAAKWLWRHENTGMMMPAAWLYPTHDQLYAFFLERPGLQESVPAGRGFSENNVASPSLMIALHYVCARKNRDQADVFFEKVATGIGFADASEPEARLRKRLIDERIGGSKLDDVFVAAFTVMTWNAVRKKKPAPLLRWRSAQEPNRPFPEVV